MNKQNKNKQRQRYIIIIIIIIINNNNKIEDNNCAIVPLGYYVLYKLLINTEKWENVTLV